MVSKNPITGDDIKSKNVTDAYRDNWDRIFGKAKSLPDTLQPNPCGTTTACPGKACQTPCNKSQ